MNARQRRHLRRHPVACAHMRRVERYGFVDAGYRELPRDVVVVGGPRIAAGTWVHSTGTRYGLLVYCRECDHEISFSPDAG